MENTRRQQLAMDGLVAAAVLALGAVLVVAGRALAGSLAPGATGDWLRIAPHILDPDQSPGFDVLLGIASSLLGLAVAAWWALSFAIAIVSALLAAAGAPRASRWTGAFTPVFMRRLAFATLGLSLVAAPSAHAAEGLPDPLWHPTTAATAPGAAAPSPAWAPTSAPAASAPADGPLTQAVAVSPSSVSVLAVPASLVVAASPGDQAGPPAGPQVSAAVPDAPEDQAAAQQVPDAAWIPSAAPQQPGLLVAQPSRQVAPEVGSAVEVRPGDSLWNIVARHLGPDASDLAIAEAWPQWYAANAAVIGDDPDRLLPGQLLQIPI